MLDQDECIPQPELERFVLGDLQADSFSRVAAHIDDCGPCQDTVVAIAEQSDTFISAMKEAGIAAPVPTENALKLGLKRMVAAIQSAPTTASALLPGELHQIGPYLIEEKLGAGGMGHVYRAVHTKLKRTVALKVLPTNRWVNAAAVSRFEREMEAIGGLDHPNIVRASDAGEDGGMHYLVMEYVDGLDLARLVRRLGPLPVADACELARQCAIGLHHAHERGLVHRDVKPSNLILASQQVAATGGLSGESATLKILDLGLALLGDEHLQEGHEITTVGTLMGTLDYMSPEQGIDSHAVDQRTDVYSLGATLFKLLTGRAPYADPQYSTLMKKMTALATKPAPSIGAVRTDLPTHLIKLIDCMLSRDPDERFDSAWEVAEALSEHAAAADLETLLRDGLAASEPAADEMPPVSVTAARQAKSHVATQLQTPRRGNSWTPWIGLLMAGTLAVVAGVLFRMATDFGELVVRSDDPDATVVVRRGDETVETLVIEKGEETIRLRSGEYTLEVQGDANVEIVPAKIAVQRNLTFMAEVQSQPHASAVTSVPAVAATATDFAPTPWRSTPQTTAGADWFGGAQPAGSTAVAGKPASLIANEEQLAILMDEFQELRQHRSDNRRSSRNAEMALREVKKLDERLKGYRSKGGMDDAEQRIEELSRAGGVLSVDNARELERLMMNVQAVRDKIASNERQRNEMFARESVESRDELDKKIDQLKAEREATEKALDEIALQFDALQKEVRAERMQLPASLTRGVIRYDTELMIEITTPSPVKGTYGLEPSGKLHLGPGIGRIDVVGMTYEEAEFAVQRKVDTMFSSIAVMLTRAPGDATHAGANRRSFWDYQGLGATSEAAGNANRQAGFANNSAASNNPASPSPQEPNVFEPAVPTYKGITYDSALNTLQIERDLGQLQSAIRAIGMLGEDRSEEASRAILAIARQPHSFKLDAGLVRDSMLGLSLDAVVEAICHEMENGNARSRDFLFRLVQATLNSNDFHTHDSGDHRRLREALRKNMGRLLRLRLSHPAGEAEMWEKKNFVWTMVGEGHDPTESTEVANLLVGEFQERTPFAMEPTSLRLMAKWFPATPGLVDAIFDSDWARVDYGNLVSLVADLGGENIGSVLDRIIERFEPDVREAMRQDAGLRTYDYLAPAVDEFGKMREEGAAAVPLLKLLVDFSVRERKPKIGSHANAALKMIDPNNSYVNELLDAAVQAEEDFAEQLNSLQRDLDGKEFPSGSEEVVKRYREEVSQLEELLVNATRQVRLMEAIGASPNRASGEGVAN